MKVGCPSCGANLNIDDKKIPAGGARIKCPTCQQIFPVKPGSAAATAGAVPLPGATARIPAASPAVPLPGLSAPTASMPSWEEESTRVMPAGMIPGALTAAAPPSNIHAVPLPGPAIPPMQPVASAPPPPSSPRAGAIPLPGQSAAPAAPTMRGAIALPGQSAPAAPTMRGAIPLPGQSAPAAASAPRAGAIPLPGQGPAPAARGAVPLPGISAARPEQTNWDEEKTRVGNEAAAPPEQSYDFDPAANNPIPLPGNYEPTRIGAPAAYGGEVDFADDADIGMVDSPSGGAIPLPGNYQHTSISQAPEAIGLPGSYEPTGQHEAYGGTEPGIPLPGSYAPTGEQPAYDLGDGGNFGDGAVPLPGSEGPTGQYAAQAVDFGAIPLPGDEAATGQYSTHGIDPAAIHDPFRSMTGEELPPPADAFAFDQPAPANTVPAAPKFDFTDLPSPRAAPIAPAYEAAPAYAAAPAYDARPPAKPASFDFADLPSPRSAARPAQAAPAPDPFEATDFSTDLPMPSIPDLPAPADPGGAEFSFDMAAPPPVSRAAPAAPPPPAAPQAAPSFGEVEFEGGGESLEFDPTSAPKGGDDLEADLSAPPVSAKPATAGDGLEMLSFIDHTARDAGAKDGQSKARRFHIRRRSGKVFGPFEDAVIIKMLEDGQLLGNEEVSIDGESWQPIGGEPSFQSAIAKLMETPSKSATTTNLPKVADQLQQQAASMDRLKNLYEGRMAAVAVVQGKEPIPFSRKLPFIVLGVLLLAAGGVGGFLGTTPYGLFGLKVLFPAKIKPGSREFAELQTAKQGLLSDTFKGYQLARETAQSTLRVKEYPEARAIWCQSIFYLQRKYAAASPAELQQAQAELENIALLGAKHPEVVKARAGLALTNKSSDEALALLGDAIARTENADDLELVFLRAEAFGLKNQLPQARSELEAILKKKPDSARALHALGNLHQAQKEADLAAGRYEEALKADPEHASSAVELAAIELLIRKDLAKGEEAIDQALAEKRRDMLGPAELGKGLALKAETLAMQHKPEQAIPLFEEALKADPGNPFTKARLATAYVALHDHAKALPYFQQASENAPESLEYAEAHLTSLIALGKMEDAMKVVTSSTARFPANARLTYLSARVDDALDRTKEAESAYLKAAAADPALVDANLYLARLYLRFRRFTDARPQLEEALKKAPNNAEVRVVMGELALADDDLPRAEAELKRAVELNPTLSEAYVGLSKLELSKGRADVALTHVDKGLAINPVVFGGRVQRGTALWKLGKLQDAVRELEAARLDDPRNTSIIVTLGAVQLEKKDLNGATGTLMAAIASEPSNPEANFYLAKVKNLKAEHTGAIEHMRKALELQPKRAEFRFWMGKIYLDAKKTPEAIDEWKQALEIDPNYTDALEALGHVFLEGNEVTRAVQYFQRALEADPKRTAVQAAIGDAHSQAEEWNDAIATYEKAIKADPELKPVYFKLGQAYGEVKKFDQAILHYRKAASVEPENAMVWLSLGYAYKERKQRAEAAAAFERYLAKSPGANNKKEIEDEIHYLKKSED